jgi:serine/threonine-protein kinase
MSPEQAKGSAVDRRADIWAFGVVLHEMLSGKAPYSDKSVQETLARVLREEPNWNALPAETPGAIRRLLERCERKDPKQRLRDIGDARIAIEEFLAHPAEGSPSGFSRGIVQPVWKESFPWVGIAVLGIALVTVLALWRPWSRSAGSASGAVIRVDAEIGANAALITGFGSSEVLSPNGSQILFSASGADGKPQLFIRSLDHLEAQPIAGTEGARDAFFSPDGQWIGFFAGGKLKKISVQGGAAVTLCEAPDDRGASWREDGTIVFSPSNRGALSVVPSAGGTPRPFTALESGEATHRWPQMLPGGKAILFTASGTGFGYNDADIKVQVLATRERKTLHHGGYYARYLNSGHLAFVHDGTLFAAPLDLNRLELTAQPVPIVEEVVSNTINAGTQFSASENGTFAYLPGKGGLQEASIYWMGRDGKTQPLRETPAGFFAPAFSPEGKRLALHINAGGRPDIWVDDIQRDTLTRLTFAGDANLRPIWTPDGQHIVYTVQDKGEFGLYWKRADGSGDAQRLTQAKVMQAACSWRPDGKVLAYSQFNPDTSVDIYTVSLEGDEKTGWKPAEPRPFLNSPADERNPAFSPDGHWLAYQANETGSFEIYVRPFPGPGGKWQVSTGGGQFPTWSRTTKELFYVSPDNRIMVVGYSAAQNSFEASKPSVWSETRLQAPNTSLWPTFALHPDGRRVAILKSPSGEGQAQTSKIVFVINFFDELRRKVPVGK